MSEGSTRQTFSQRYGHTSTGEVNTSFGSKQLTQEVEKQLPKLTYETQVLQSLKLSCGFGLRTLQAIITPGRTFGPGCFTLNLLLRAATLQSSLQSYHQG